MAPLHRQYKTARTETRWHLLLKIRQMPIQTSASRGYVLFRSADKRCTKVLKLSADYEHTLWKVQTWKDTEFDVQRGMEEIFGFSSKELPPPVASGTLHISLLPIIKCIPFIVQCTRATAHFNLRASLRSHTFRHRFRVPQVQTLCWRMRGMKWQQSASSLHP